ncbi:MAG: hypothetical protein QF570_19710 [Myxococcota bacterium]|jgi:hypothetical protein|nr:hypothetical protein [Myxococcota bacterium]
MRIGIALGMLDPATFQDARDAVDAVRRFAERYGTGEPNPEPREEAP